MSALVKKEILAQKQVLIPLCVSVSLLITMISNFLLHIVLQLASSLGNITGPLEFNISAAFLIQTPVLKYPFYYMIVGVFIILVNIKVVYDMKTNFAAIATDEKGSQRFSTEKELRDQYKRVPLKKEKYKGKGGIVISRSSDELLIDDGSVNNCIIGTTRSGKGELVVFPTIDVYSRAEHQPSLIINDPKGELFTASKETLESRGYHIEVLNLLDQDESMSYNLLQLIKDAYLANDFSTAQMLCKSLSYSLYFDPKDPKNFWASSSMSLCNAIILAVIDKCIKESTPEKITMYTVANMLSSLGSKELPPLRKGGETRNALDVYFQNLPDGHVAKNMYATSNFAKGNTRGSIFTTAMDGLSFFTFDATARMTSKNSIDLKKVGFGKMLEGVAEPRTKIKVTFPDGSKLNVKANVSGRWICNFTQNIQEGDILLVNNKKYLIKEINKDTGETSYEIQSGQDNTSTNLLQVTYFNKPIAIFMITPDYDASNHVIASIFIRQLYFVLSKNASLTRSGECHREVVFLLDEFGNMPAIDNMGSIITVCLGRKIRFNLIIQGYAQVKKLYGEDADNILGNCGNHIYILSTDQSTVNKFSEMLGEKTYVLSSRSGPAFSLDKSITHSIDGRRLLTPSELLELKMGETVVIRSLKRDDQKFNRVRPRPIYNTDKTTMRYRYEYLADDFDTNKSILDVDINSIHYNVNPMDLLIDFTGDFNSENSDEFEELFNAIEQGAADHLASKDENRNIADEQTESIKEVVQLSKEPPYEEQDNKISHSLTIDNWQDFNVEQFFVDDIVTLQLIERISDQNNIDLVSRSMTDFQNLLKLLAHSDRVQGNVYKVIRGKIKEKIENLKQNGRYEY